MYAASHHLVMGSGLVCDECIKVISFAEEFGCRTAPSAEGH